jgi:hypothetical protein
VGRAPMRSEPWQVQRMVATVGTNNVIRGRQSSFCAESTAEAQCNFFFAADMKCLVLQTCSLWMIVCWMCKEVANREDAEPEC